MRTRWSAFGKFNDIMKSNMSICMKHRVFDQCILPSMTYGTETWAMKKIWNKNIEQYKEAW